MTSRIDSTTPIWTGLKGLFLTDEEKEWLSVIQPYGIILYQRNCESFPQIQQLIDSVRQVSPRSRIGIDEEGGRVTRLPPPFPRYPSFSEHALSSNWSQNLAHQADDISAFFHKLGIDVVFAPVVDLHYPGKTPSFLQPRCFSDRVDEVIQAASILVEGFLKNGIAPCLKHFPGHGAASGDSHVDLPVVDLPYSVLSTQDWAPYRFFSAKVPYVMTAHVQVLFFGQNQVATLNPEIIGLLKNEIGFTGHVIADDLYMQGILGYYGVKENWVYWEYEIENPQLQAPPVLRKAYEDCLKSGCDSVILSRSISVHGYLFA